MDLEKIGNIFIFLLIILLPTQLGFHFWPPWTIISGMRVDYFSPTLYLTDVLITLLLLTILVIWVKKQALRDSGVTASWRRAPRTSLAYCVIGLLVLFNVYFSSSPPVSLYKWVKILEMVFLVIFLKKQLEVFRLRNLVILALILVVSYEFVLTFWQFLIQHSVGGWWYFLGERTFFVDTPAIAKTELFNRLVVRPYGTFSHPNVLGGVLAVLLPLLLLIKTKIKKEYLGLALCLGYLTLFLSFSRLSIIAGLASLFVVLLPKIKTRKLRALTVGVFLSIIVVCLLFFVDFGTQKESLAVRFQFNMIALNRFVHFPIVGTGLGTSPLYTLNWQFGPGNYRLTTTNYSLYGQPIHNLYFLLLSETGIVGLALFGWAIYKISKTFLSLSYCPLITLLFLGLFDHYWLTSQQGLLTTSLVIAFVWSASNIESGVK